MPLETETRNIETETIKNWSRDVDFNIPVFYVLVFFIEAILVRRRQQSGAVAAAVFTCNSSSCKSCV